MKYADSTCDYIAKYDAKWSSQYTLTLTYAKISVFNTNKGFLGSSDFDEMDLKIGSSKFSTTKNTVNLLVTKLFPNLSDHIKTQYQQ